MRALTAEPTLATPGRCLEVPELSCQDLAKSLGGVPVLENVSFDFLKGTVNILAGENGAGKSTILEIVSGQYHPDKGTVRVAGEPVTSFDPRHARRLGIGIVPGSPLFWTCPSTRTSSSVGSCIRGSVSSTTSG